MNLNEKKLQDAFTKIKKDIFDLQSQIFNITHEIRTFKRTLEQTDKPTDRQTVAFFPLQTLLNKPSEASLTSTDVAFQQTLPTEKPSEESPKPPKNEVSIGNKGVPTDRQTDQQTDQQVEKFAQYTNSQEIENSSIPQNSFTTPLQTKRSDKLTKLMQVSEIIGSLDILKKDIRSLFKKLTPQEMQIYSMIYQLSDQGFVVDYSLLASKTSLTESSVRDYVLKLQKKGAPLSKSKENNKKILLSIPSDFKKIASLSTIISLREL